EVYRTQGAVVHVAERVRENLIMDSGVCIDGKGKKVVFYTRAQRGDFPGESEEALYGRARSLGEAAVGRGFEVAGRFVTEVPDPGDDAVTLDRWYQVQFEKAIASIEDAVELVRFAFGIEKTA